MKKICIACLLGGILLSGSIAVSAEYAVEENQFPVQLNGENVTLEGYNVNDSTYFKLRDIASVIGGFNVDFENDTIKLTTGEYQNDEAVGDVMYYGDGYTVTENEFPIQLNGEDVIIEGYNINDSTYFKLRDIASVIGGFDVDFYDNTIQLAKDGYVYPKAIVSDKYIGSYAIPSTVKDEVIGEHYLTITEITSDHVVFYLDRIDAKRIIYRGPFDASFVSENKVTGTGFESYFGKTTTYSLVFDGDNINVYDLYNGEENYISTYNINENRIDIPFDVEAIRQPVMDLYAEMRD